MNKKNWVTILIILAILILSYSIITRSHPQTDIEVVKCIGEHSKLYTQLGCHACETQKNLFGENYNLLNVVDCFYEREKCEGIEATPTWIINGKKIKGVQSVEELKKLTNC